MNLPSRQDINVHNSLDERSACEHFLGKNLEEAEVLFREITLTCFEDLMWMGPVAFRFYVMAAIRYFKSEASANDSDAVDSFIVVLKFRMECERLELKPVAQELASICDYIIENYQRFESDPDIYGDERPRINLLRQAFLQLIEANGEEETI